MLEIPSAKSTGKRANNEFLIGPQSPPRRVSRGRPGDWGRKGRLKGSADAVL